jgi:hypothetical protein
VLPGDAGTRSPWRTWLLTGVALIAGALALAAWNPGDDAAGTLCLFRRLTHHECATCGLTRSLAHLVRGDLAGAFARHALGPPLALELALLWLAWPVAIARHLRIPAYWGERWLLAHAAVFLAYWAVRLAR